MIIKIHTGLVVVVGFRRFLLALFPLDLIFLNKHILLINIVTQVGNKEEIYLVLLLPFLFGDGRLLIALLPLDFGLELNQLAIFGIRNSGG